MSATEYGLLGHPLGHSLSPYIHLALMRSAGLDGEYSLIDLAPEQLPVRLPAMLDDLAGFNITIPYKQTVIPYLDGLDEAAELYGSVNTVWQRRGYNTDYHGFISNCPDLGSRRLLILGAGGVSRTMAFAAARAGASMCILARRIEQAVQLKTAVQKAFPDAAIQAFSDIEAWLDGPARQAGDPWGLLNGTPLGLWPQTSGLPVPADVLDHFSFVFDTIYNPVSTRLVLKARSLGIEAAGGLGMLFDQAAQAQRIWHPDLEFSVAGLASIQQTLAREILARFPQTILLTGYMGSGKSTVGPQLAEQLGVSYTDLDDSIVARAGQSIPDIFAEQGEPGFRRLERSMLADLLKNPESQVVALGGGALIDKAAEALCRKYPVLIIHLDTPLDIIASRVLSKESRPLLKDKTYDDLAAIYESRKARYFEAADYVASGAEGSDRACQDILESLGFSTSSNDG